MIGLDTSFLVAFEIAEHPRHDAARAFAAARAEEGFALAPQILAEFAHVVTDERRFQHPLEMTEAVTRVEKWWHAREARVVSPDVETGALFFRLIRAHALGRKRLLDALLAATYLSNGVHVVATLDRRGFADFPGFAPISV